MSLPKNYAERVAEVASRQARIQATCATEIEALAAKVARARAEAAQDVADLENDAEALRRTLERVIAGRFLNRAVPVLGEWVDGPSRSLAGRFVEAVRDSDRECVDQLGLPLSSWLLASAMAHPLLGRYVGAYDAFGDYSGSMGHHSICDAAGGLLAATRIGAPQTYSDLEALEKIMLLVASRYAGAPLSDRVPQERFAAASLAATAAERARIVAAWQRTADGAPPTSPGTTLASDFVAALKARAASVFA